ncbi:putative inactive glycosyltransferase 25 family member 3 [Gracilariopsis chorda]|uniref:Putative inactive glycosyltransferase 25 family member 3 n=1 Tax=Gracilariopsis chorda TaxID=448386 RepID=A0A2V3IJS2_9FLOR|nr:putative inactive glycosyltransferase 25 family member 3 [Gracilariopsis chorda]|eukprot:PXF42283.1 putative inactive glycosyltransferase 25 family member 3 [Gracilariopsis chorda]
MALLFPWEMLPCCMGDKLSNTGMISTRYRLDAIYVIGMQHCEQRWGHINAWASEHNIEVTPLYATRYDEIDFVNPPVPITSVPSRAVVSTGEVACTFSHIRAWRHAFSRNYSNIIVLEDDVRLTTSLLKRLPRIIQDAYIGSAVRDNMPWHFIFLRVQPTSEYFREIWHGDLKRAGPGWGSAAYLLSASGIRFLLTRITSYSFPLDVQFERLQRGKGTMSKDFVTLHACMEKDNGEFSLGCPENVHELSDNQRGNCAHSGSQLGNRMTGVQLPGSVQPGP